MNSNEMLNFLGSWASIVSFAFTLVGIVLAVLGWIYRKTIRRWFMLNQFKPGTFAPADLKVDGLIYTVSRSNWTIESLKCMRPKYVGVVGSDKEEFRKAAREVCDYVRDTLKAIAYEPKLVDNTDLPEPAKKACADLIRQMRKDKVQNIGVDVTGGKVPMSIGAFMAAEEMGVTSYYTATHHKDADTRRGKSKLVILSQYPAE